MSNKIVEHISIHKPFDKFLILEKIDKNKVKKILNEINKNYTEIKQLEKELKTFQ